VANEIGWRLAHDAWGNGYATEGAAAARCFVFDALGWREIVAFTASTNHRSERVMQRLGMTHDPSDDFDHPHVEAGHLLRRHLLYRTRAD
jgi:RimJ/RimL family protein N-acetyltransferase